MRIIRLQSAQLIHDAGIALIGAAKLGAARFFARVSANAAAQPSSVALRAMHRSKAGASDVIKSHHVARAARTRITALLSRPACGGTREGPAQAPRRRAGQPTTSGAQLWLTALQPDLMFSEAPKDYCCPAHGGGQLPVLQSCFRNGPLAAP